MLKYSAQVAVQQSVQVAFQQLVTLALGERARNKTVFEGAACMLPVASTKRSGRLRAQGVGAGKSDSVQLHTACHAKRQLSQQ